MLCGVMRVGLVAKGLLIKGDMDLELVLMCRDKPTQTLLDTVCHNLPTQIQVRDPHTLLLTLFGISDLFFHTHHVFKYFTFLY